MCSCFLGCFRAASNLVSNSWKDKHLFSISSAIRNGSRKESFCTASSKHAVILRVSNAKRRFVQLSCFESACVQHSPAVPKACVACKTFWRKSVAREKESCRGEFAIDGLETVALSYKDFACAAPDESSPILITHGLLGSKNNWNSIAKSLRQTLQRRIVIADARNHGDSPWTARHDYGSMSEDFLRLLDHLNVEKTIFMGHSMGGRTAVTFALNHPDRLDKLIVVDITPGAYRGSAAVSYVKLLNNITWNPAETLSQVRRNVDAQLALHIDDNSLRQFLLTNLVSADDNRAKWKCNLKALAENHENLMGHAAYPGTQFHGPTLFVAGSKSNFIQVEDMARIRELFPKAELTLVPDAGHWVHSDNPRHFLEVVAQFCTRQKAL